MGLDFSALIRCDVVGRGVLSAIARLESGEEDAALRPVVALGLQRGFAFAEYAERARGRDVWRPWSDIERELPGRSELPSLDRCLDLHSNFLLTFGNDGVWVYHTLRWVYFATDPEWQSVMLAAVGRLCVLLEASDCIITNDEHPAVSAFGRGSSYQQALQIAEAEGEGAVSSLGDLYIDRGDSNDLVFSGPNGEEVPVPIWDTRGFWRFDFKSGPPPVAWPAGGTIDPFRADFGMRGGPSH